MNDKEERRYTIAVIGSGASDEIIELATALAETSGISVDETCNSIVNATQFLSVGVETAMETLEKLTKALIETCESCIEEKGRRTWHGSSSRTEKPRKASVVIKWRVKIRPP